MVWENLPKSCFAHLLPDPQLQQELAAGSSNFKGQLQGKLSLFDPLNLELNIYLSLKTLKKIFQQSSRRFPQRQSPVI